MKSLVALPTDHELLVYIISFLTNIRDIVTLRYVSRRLRSVSEIPSLWRVCIWPHLDASEEHCAKKVLKSRGQYIKRITFPFHVAPFKLRSGYCAGIFFQARMVFYSIIKHTSCVKVSFIVSLR